MARGHLSNSERERRAQLVSTLKFWVDKRQISLAEISSLSRFLIPDEPNCWLVDDTVRHYMKAKPHLPSSGRVQGVGAVVKFLKSATESELRSALRTEPVTRNEMRKLRQNGGVGYMGRPVVKQAQVPAQAPSPGPGPVQAKDDLADTLFAIFELLLPVAVEKLDKNQLFEMQNKLVRAAVEKG